MQPFIAHIFQPYGQPLQSILNPDAVISFPAIRKEPQILGNHWVVDVVGDGHLGILLFHVSEINCASIVEPPSAAPF